MVAAARRARGTAQRNITPATPAQVLCDRCDEYAVGCMPVDGIKVKDKGAATYREFVACPPCWRVLNGAPEHVPQGFDFDALVREE